jgi:hypothetical protein
MISIVITSRLGNQLFQYAFGYAVARKLKTGLYVNDKEGQHGYFLKKYFILQKRKIIRDIVLALSFKWLKKTNKIQLVRQAGWDDPDSVISKISDFTEYRGYFQSLEYFSAYEKDIQQLFTIKDRFVNDFNKKYRALFEQRKTIVVHLRRTDYIRYGRDILGGKNMCLPDNYVICCLSKIENLGDYNLIFISDDIDYAIHTFSGLFPAARFEHDAEITDLQFLMHADILVLSNSTFAWWGAFLNRKKEKIVYAPEHWVGFKIGKEYPSKIICPGWITVNATTPAATTGSA